MEKQDRWKPIKQLSNPWWRVKKSIWIIANPSKTEVEKKNEIEQAIDYSKKP